MWLEPPRNCQDLLPAACATAGVKGGPRAGGPCFFFWAFQKGDLNTHVWIHITFFTRGRWGDWIWQIQQKVFFSIWGKARFFSFKCFYSPRNVSINGAARFKSLLVCFGPFFSVLALSQCLSVTCPYVPIFFCLVACPMKLGSKARISGL